jgi:hypothetical protein
MHGTGWPSSQSYRRGTTRIGQGCLTASCSRIHCVFLTQGPGTPSTWCGADPQIGDVRGK